MGARDARCDRGGVAKIEGNPAVLKMLASTMVELIPFPGRCCPGTKRARWRRTRSCDDGKIIPE